MSELKPCPFCGGIARQYESGGYREEWCQWVECDSCRAAMSGYAAVWNGWAQIIASSAKRTYSE
jgi:hypothetical protein